MSELLESIRSGCDNPHVEPIVLICLATGARWSEAENLKPTSIRNGVITFSGTKSGKVRSVPISTDLQDLIIRHWKQFGLFSGAITSFRRALARTTIDLPRGQGTPAPIGNLRIKESADAIAGRPVVGFTRGEVVSCDSRFLEYAYEQGAAIGGATGAGGEAPKLLLTEDHHGALHPDAVLPDAEATQHWFVKFARNKASQTDQDILRSEYCFYRAVQQLGLDTIAAQGLALEEGRKPSLWMHRFDREVGSAGVNRVAVESMYSLAGVVEAGSYMSHSAVLRNLVTLWQGLGQAEQVGDLVFEYMQRDLLNQILGNSANHGRNTAILRTEQGVSLAPIYDLAPMVMDDEGVTRTTKWPKHIELAGEVDWRAACDEAAAWLNPETLFQRLRGAAQTFLALPDLLSADGLPAVTMNHPRIAL